jgi:steroid 5-alpha reductase family enzyme
MVFPISFLWLFAAAMVISAIGFKNYVWFISLGYGFSIAGEGVLMLILYGNGLSLGTILCCALFILYGLRLGGYLAIRELGSSSYKKNMKGEIKEGSSVPFGVKIAIWVTCALLYVTQVSGVFYRLHNAAADNAFVFIGAAIMALGLILETAADLQKNAAKKINPKRFVDTGLYRLVRCPNYLGEMIFWTGVLVSAIGAVSHWGQWIVIAVGYIGIIFVMFSGARRLEIRQDKNYGADPEYQKYVTTVPILLPFIPLYSVKKHKWLVA